MITDTLVRMKSLGFLLVLSSLLLQDAATDVNVPFVPQHSTGYCELFVQSSNYTCSEEVVQTQDGYLLALQRIVSRTFVTSPKGPVLLYHGIMEVLSKYWRRDMGVQSREESLALMMANSGYEVWIGNTRSSNYTYGHILYTRKDKKYWDWCWDDLVRTDLPTMLQFVHDHSKQLVYYVGYSQGTMTALAAFSQGTTVNLVSKAALLSPIGSLGHITSPVASAASWLFVDEILLLAGVAEFNAYRHEFMSQITGDRPSVPFATSWSPIPTAGVNCCFNNSRISFYNEYSAQSTSMRNLAQMAQMVRSGKFSMYDHGFWGNLKKYSSFFPPEYDVSAIPPSLPIILAHGGNDALADPDDVTELINNLQSTPQVVYLPNYAHADFVMGTTARIDVYTKILAFFQS